MLCVPPVCLNTAFSVLFSLRGMCRKIHMTLALIKKNEHGKTGLQDVRFTNIFIILFCG